MTNAIIEKAFNKNEHIIATASGVLGHINLSEIATILIQNVGRFCEQYASDFLITWNTVEQLVSEYKPDETSEIICFAIRRQGVDHNTFLLNRLEEHQHIAGWVDTYYRQILALEIKKEPNIDNSIRVTCTLKNITHSIRYS